MEKKLTWGFAVAATSIAALVLAGCATTGVPADDPSEKKGLSEAAIASFLAYSGSTEGAATSDAEPIRIGWVNQNSGPGATVELTTQFEDAIELINTQLGGIGGSPIEVQTCDIATEEDGQACAQQLANDDSIVAIGQGSIVNGSASFHSIIDPAAIPVVGAVPLGADDGGAPNSFYLAPGAFSTIPAILTLIKDGHIDAKSVAVVTVAGEFVSTTVGTQLADALKGLGVEVRSASIDLTATDVTAPLVAAGADTADVVIPLVILPPQCTAVATALDSLATDATIVGLSACYSAGVRDALGDYPKWAYLSAAVNSHVPEADAEVQAQADAYNEWMGLHDYTQDGTIPLQTALGLQRHLIAAGAVDATREGVVETARAWTGPVFLGMPDVAYGSVTKPFPLPALPGLQMRIYQYEGDGSFTDLTDGAWIG